MRYSQLLALFVPIVFAAAEAKTVSKTVTKTFTHSKTITHIFTTTFTESTTTTSTFTSTSTSTAYTRTTSASCATNPPAVDMPNNPLNGGFEYGVIEPFQDVTESSYDPDDPYVSPPSIPMPQAVSPGHSSDYCLQLSCGDPTGQWTPQDYNQYMIAGVAQNFTIHPGYVYQFSWNYRIVNGTTSWGKTAEFDGLTFANVYIQEPLLYPSEPPDDFQPFYEAHITGRNSMYDYYNNPIGQWAVITRNFTIDSSGPEMVQLYINLACAQNQTAERDAQIQYDDFFIAKIATAS